MRACVAFYEFVTKYMQLLVIYSRQSRVVKPKSPTNKLTLMLETYAHIATFFYQTLSIYTHIIFNSLAVYLCLYPHLSYTYSHEYIQTCVLTYVCTGGSHPRNWLTCVLTLAGKKRP